MLGAYFCSEEDRASAVLSPFSFGTPIGLTLLAVTLEAPVTSEPPYGDAIITPFLSFSDNKAPKPRGHGQPSGERLPTREL
jgi:hypothetical protein